MRRILYLLAAVCIGGQPIAWADSYIDVQYLEGLPGFSAGPLQGRLHVEEAGITFEDGKGREFQVPLAAIREQGYQTTSQTSKPRGFIFAGPNPIVMAATLGASLVGNVVARPKTNSEYLYKVRFTGHDGMVYDVRFRVPDQATQTAILNDMRELNDRYNVNIVRQQPESKQETVMTATSEPVVAPELADTPVNALLLNEMQRIDAE